MPMGQMNIDFLAPEVFAPMYEPAIAALKAKGHDAQWFREGAAYLKSGRLPKVDVLVDVDGLKVGPREMDQAPNLRALVTPVVGIEDFDEKAATERLIVIANGHTVENYTSMAEASLLLVLASLYDFAGTQRYMDNSLERPDPPRAHILMGKTVGLIGFGRIAQTLAERLVPFGCAVQAAIRTPRQLPHSVAVVSLEDLLRTSQVIVVASEINAETRGMLTAERLALMKPDVVFVNISRGGIADDLVVAKLAAERPEMRIALDVYDPEPLDPSSPLRKLPNAILTPHMIGHTSETFAKIPEALLENILRPLAGEVPLYVRNRSIIPAWTKKWSKAGS